MGSAEMQSIGRWILEVLRGPEDEACRARVRGQVLDLCRQFPVPLA
jgi:glycine hydroxymethyltransferase